ncbi:MAG TPA: hypothetical protein EYP19_12675 [Desulfobacterales bacterium]|nr:hypothetical protein [Desulfobacterales bacterium]
MLSPRNLFLCMALMTLACPGVHAQSAASDQKAFADFKAAMEKVVDKFEARGKSFQEIVDQLTDLSGVNIVVDPKLAQRLGAEKIAVNLNLKNIRVKNIIAILLRMYNLSADYSNEVLYISAPDDLYRGQETITRKYNVRSIIYERPQFYNTACAGTLLESQIRRRGIIGWSSRRVEDFEVDLLRDRRVPELMQKRFEENGEKLVQYIKSTIAPRTWAQQDNGVAITFNKEGTITVTHVLPVHVEILKLLESLEKK